MHVLEQAQANSMAESRVLATELHAERRDRAERGSAAPDVVLGDDGAGGDPELNARLAELSQRFDRFSETVEQTLVGVRCCVNAYQERQHTLEHGLCDVQHVLQEMMETASEIQRT